MLSFKRNDGESFYIYPDRDTDPDMTLAELFKSGPIEVMVCQRGFGGTQVGVAAPKTLTIRRDDFIERRKWQIADDKHLSF